MGRRLRLAPPAGELAAGFAALRAELGVPESYPPAAEAEAEAAVDAYAGARTDATDLPLVTVDPPGSRDLDQAYTAERRGDGYRLRYAIADPGAFVRAGGALDAESRARGVTLYSPDRRTPLYPPSLSEGRASLLPGADVPALLWTVDLDAAGEPETVRVHRATVRSRATLSYEGVQRSLDDGTADEPLRLLREIGTLREERERDRGGVSLGTPDQEVVPVAGGYALAYRPRLPVEDWNAQVSLLTGTCAARIMLDGGVGLLRTMPPPADEDVAELRRSAHALGVAWPEGVAYGGFVSALDPAVPAEAATLTLAQTLLRGAGYTAFDGAPPEPREHSAVAAPYAHVTAPLRRLADRFANEVVLALHEGRDVPARAREALPALPDLMVAADRRARELERAVLDYVEAVMLRSRVGETFAAVVVGNGMVQLADPAVRARYAGAARPGETVTVRLTEADPEKRRVRFGD
ncbi:MAG TPA: RNB domain-containing ribonuclease [Frankiaceae bacterium]|nr:RNB domain-containing ribonuclease [Frankiaceae bacterium]